MRRHLGFTVKEVNEMSWVEKRMYIDGLLEEFSQATDEEGNPVDPEDPEDDGFLSAIAARVNNPHEAVDQQKADATLTDLGITITQI